MDIGISEGVAGLAVARRCGDGFDDRPAAPADRSPCRHRRSSRCGDDVPLPVARAPNFAVLLAVRLAVGVAIAGYWTLPSARASQLIRDGILLWRPRSRSASAWPPSPGATRIAYRLAGGVPRRSRPQCTERSNCREHPSRGACAPDRGPHDDAASTVEQCTSSTMGTSTRPVQSAIPTMSRSNQHAELRVRAWTPLAENVGPRASAAGLDERCAPGVTPSAGADPAVVG